MANPRATASRQQSVTQRAKRVMAWWSRQTKKFDKIKCRLCGGNYPCDQHNIEP